MDCRHRKQFPGMDHCYLIDRAPAPCEACESQWVDGSPPNADRLTPILVEISNGRKAREQPVKSTAPKREHIAPPTVLEMAANFGTAMLRWIGAGFPVVEQEQFDARLCGCRGCDLWDESARAGLGKCNHPTCGCSNVKLWLATEKCPLGKWT